MDTYHFKKSSDDVGNAKFMKSSWHHDPNKRALTRNPLAWLGYVLMYKGGQGVRSEKIPVHTVWAQRECSHLLVKTEVAMHCSSPSLPRRGVIDLWVFPRALLPMAIQYTSMRYFSLIWPTWLAGTIYALYLVVFASMMLLHMNNLAEKYGFLDASARRDQIPDQKLTSTMVRSLLSGALSAWMETNDKSQLNKLVF